MAPREPATRQPLIGSDSDVTFPVLAGEVIDELAALGEERQVGEGDILYRAGDAVWDFYVLVEGHVDIVREGDPEELVVSYGAGQFIGELSLLTGQKTYLTARSTGPGTVLKLTHAEFRRLMATNPAIADVIFGALIARREALRATPAALAVRIIGSRYSSEALALRTFASRNHVAHAWIDLDEADDVETLLATRGLRAGDTPVVVTPTEVLRHPTPGQFADALGLTYHPVPGRIFDLVVVGVGPAGLAASVYGASEGLDTVSLDAVAPGGQAGASSRIENYAGFPNGISGEDLTARTAIQAQRLGAWLVSPCEVSGLRAEQGFHVVSLVDQSEIPGRAVIIATGARYQRLPVPDLERFEGRGVYYAATDLEARSCDDADVLVVGGGNSAGQAALYLCQSGSRVFIAVRRADLSVTMSSYLIDRITAEPRIEVLTQTEVRTLAGDTHLDSVTVEHTPSGVRRVLGCSALFCFIGAEPATSWLRSTLTLDEKGFIPTDRSLPAEALGHPDFSTRPPFPFETSLPGVFAVGDVRSGSMKRVASAVGEGSSAVRTVCELLSLQG